jgi:hypothetical protein
MTGGDFSRVFLDQNYIFQWLMADSNLRKNAPRRFGFAGGED